MRFVTLLTPEFLPGAVALVNSLNKNAGIDYDLTIINSGGDPDEIEETLGRKAKINIIPIASLGEFKPPNSNNQMMNRLIPALQKLLVFKLESEGPMCFLDADMICVGDLRGIETFSHFTATMLFGITLANPVHGRPQFSTGMFCFKPSREFFDELQDFALSYDGPIRLADQDILNPFMWSRYPNDVHLLSIEWERSKRVWLMHKDVWHNAQKKRFIHFVGDKPWLPNPDSAYAALNKLWWEQYQDGQAKPKNAEEILEKPLKKVPIVPKTKLTEFLEGKSVAVVAPGAHIKGSNQRELIDSHDVVVRLNRGFPVQAGVIEDVGNRTDILYHIMTGHAGSITTDEKILDRAVAEVKFIVSVHPRNDSYVTSFENRINGRTGFEAVPLSLRQFIRARVRSMPNCGVIAIAHLLSQPIKSLYLTGFSFYETGYYVGYRKDWTPEAQSKYRGVSGHHQPSQKVFVKWLLENTNIPVTMDKIMSLIMDNVLGWEEQAAILNAKAEKDIQLRALQTMRHGIEMIPVNETFFVDKKIAMEFIRKRRAVLVQ